MSQGDLQSRIPAGFGGSTGKSDLAQVPIPSLIDADTLKSALTSTAYEDGAQYKLVFSGDFNIDGQFFYPGDDPF